MTQGIEANSHQQNGAKEPLSNGQSNAKRGKKSMIWLVAIGLVALLIFGVPFFAKQQIEKHLTVLLGKEVSIESLTINVFTGEIELNGLDATGSDASDLKIGTRLQRVAVDIEIGALFRRHLMVDLAEVNGLSLPMSFQPTGLFVAGVQLTGEGGLSENSGSSTEESVSWQISVKQLEVTDSVIEFRYGESIHAIEVDSVTLGDYVSIAPQGIKLVGDLKFDGAKIKLSGLADQGDTGDSAISGSLEIKNLMLQTYANLLGASVENLAGQLDLSQDFTVLLSNGTLQVDSGGYIQLTSVEELRGSADSLRHTGSFSFQLASSAIERLSTNGQLLVDGLRMPDIATIELVDWRGEASLSANDAFAIAGDLAVQQLLQEDVGTVGSIEVQDFKVQGLNSFTAASFSVSNTDVLVAIDADGELVLPSFLTSTSSGGDRDIEQNQANKGGQPSHIEESSFDLTITQVNVDQSRIEFIDRSVEPIVDLVLENITVELNNLSLVELFQFKLQANHQSANDLDALLAIEGELGLENQNGSLKLDLRQFELHEIAPYMGSGVKSGRLQLKSTINMEKGRMQIGNNVHIKNVKVDERTQGSSDQMSLSTALFLLKDKDDVVELDVPFETDFNNFEIGFSDIIQTAMLKAAQTTAVAYAQYALQPYGSLLLAKNILGAVTRPKFEPILFTEAQETLSVKDKAYVTKLGEFLVQKSELTVTVCGFAQTRELAALQAQQLAADMEGPTNEGSGKKSEADNEVVESTEPTADDIVALKKLAESRAHAVRDLLLEAGVSSERLYACSAAVEAKAKAKEPRVELAL